MYQLLKFVPKNHLSYAIGCLVKTRLPFGLSSLVIKTFATRYGVILEEAEKSIEGYKSLFDFFTRRLKPGVRPIEQGVVSPVDGKIVEFGAIVNGQLIQAKGKTYTVESLLQNKAVAKNFQEGYFITIYLAPGDYHRIHYPVSGKVKSYIYVKGALWPVNNWSVENIHELFSINERLITLVDSGKTSVAVVKVGATNVGAIRAFYCDLVTNQSLSLTKKHQVTEKHFSESILAEKGAEMAMFEMGSTVILLFEKDTFLPNQTLHNQMLVKVGQSIGELTK